MKELVWGPLRFIDAKAGVQVKTILKRQRNRPQSRHGSVLSRIMASMAGSDQRNRFEVPMAMLWVRELFAIAQGDERQELMPETVSLLGAKGISNTGIGR
jgi:hypothetical protein